MPLVSGLSRNYTIVLKLSGGLFFSEEFDNVATSLKSIVTRKKNLRLVIVAGGGRIAREYISAAKRIGADQTSQDELGIAGSQLNALVLTKALGTAAVEFVPKTLDHLVETFEVAWKEKRIVVVGGLQPGQSTNAVGALICEKLRAKLFLNATDVDGVYTKDPQKHKNAKRFSRISPKQLAKILSSESMKAGGYELMDPIALKLIERSKIPTWIIKCDASTIEKFLFGRGKVGTRIVFD